MALADTIGGRWPEAARTAAVELSGRADDVDVGIQLLSDIREVFYDEDEPEVLQSSRLVGCLTALSEPLRGGRCPYSLHGILRWWSTMPALGPPWRPADRLLPIPVTTQTGAVAAQQFPLGTFFFNGAS